MNKYGMKIADILEVMRMTKDCIQSRQEQSSPYFYDDLWDEEVQWMHDTYPEIEALPGVVYSFLWDKAVV